MLSDPADLDSVLSQLFSKRTGLIKPGLSRMRQAIDYFPELAELPPVALIAGTNGKGSTAGMLWYLLGLAGKKVGLYTSPHLCHFRERIQIFGSPIADSELLATLTFMSEVIPEDLYKSMSFFEVTTLLAALTFCRQKCDWIILEVGMGGRWDSTNVFAPSLTAIVSISFDHQAWLGTTLNEILAEKLGICRSDVPLFWGQSPGELEKVELTEIIRQRSVQQGFPVLQMDHDFWVRDGVAAVRSEGGRIVSVVLPEWFSARAPILQKNFALALAMFLRIFETGSEGLLDPSCIQELISRFACPGTPWPASLVARFQRLTITDPGSRLQRHLMVDVCHNVDSVCQLIVSLRSAYGLAPGAHLPGIVSISKDKDIPEMLRLLRSVLQPLVLFKIDNERAMSQTDLGPENQDLFIHSCFSDAWAFCLDQWQGNDAVRPWVICGSFFTVGEVFRYFDVLATTHNLQGVLAGTFHSLS